MASNFVIMATHCDGGNVLLYDALMACQAFANVINYAQRDQLYMFNNSAMFTCPRDENQRANHKMFWDMGQASMKRFVDDFLF